MKDLINTFLQWAVSNNWNVSKNTESIKLPHVIQNRYYKIKELTLFMTFINIVSNCSSPDDCSWFLCLSDYDKENLENEFAWNEFEKISIESASDAEEKAKISNWWNRHIPIFISVKEEYSFFAIDLTNNLGHIVQGFEPEFEDTTLVANSFEEFLYFIIIGKIKI